MITTKTVIGAALALTMSAGAAMAAPGQATTSVNVRSGPSTAYQVVDTLYPGENVDIRQCDAGWCYVQHNGPDGWVSERYLEGTGYAPARGPSIFISPPVFFPPHHHHPHPPFPPPHPPMPPHPIHPPIVPIGPVKPIFPAPVHPNPQPHPPFPGGFGGGKGPNGGGGNGFGNVCILKPYLPQCGALQKP